MIRMMRNYRNRYRKLLAFLKMEQTRSPKPFSEKSLLLKGFFSQKKELYPFEKYDYSLFLTDWEIEFFIGAIGEHRPKSALSDKLYFNLLLQGESNPQFIGLIDENGFRSFSGCKTLNEGFQTYGRLICKPQKGNGGKGIRFVTKGDECRVDAPHIIEAPITPDSYARDIFPGSLNTIRVITLRDNDGAFIAGAAHRFGTNRTGYIDSFSKGGIAAGIDTESGEMAAGRSNPGIYADTHHDRHPDTDKPIKNVMIPRWQEVKRLALGLSDRFPKIYYVGWDIAITPDRVIVIEGNPGVANPNLIQANRPLLIDQRTAEFMVSQGVISRSKAARAYAHR